MNDTPKIISIEEARIILGLPNFLIHDFTSYEFNGKKLDWHDEDKLQFDEAVVFDFNKHLGSRWPPEKRKPPEPVERYLIWEASNRCALCEVEKSNYECAHVKDWSKTFSHHPHNILYLCVACHAKWTKKSSDYPTKLLQLTKEELLRKKGLILADQLFDCEQDMEVGDAVRIQEDRAIRAIAMDTERNLATCFVSTIFGARCTVVRAGLAVGIRGLVTDAFHYLSPTRPGKIGTLDVVQAEYDSLRLHERPRQPYWQCVGRAESTCRLAIQFQQGSGLPQGV